MTKCAGTSQGYIIKDPGFYKRVMVLMIPIVLQSIINQGVNMMDTVMVGRLGEAAISASNLANQFYNIFVFLCMGVSAGGLVLSSQYFGAGDLNTVRRVFDLVLQILLLFGTAFSLITFFFPTQIMQVYTNDTEVITLGAEYLRVTAFIFLPHGISLCLSQLCRSIGNTRLGLYISIASFIINIGANYVFIFGKLGFPAMGVMGAAVGTLCARIVELISCCWYLLRAEKLLNYRPNKLFKLPHPALFREFRRLGLPPIISDSLLALAASTMSIILGHMGKEVVSAYAIVTVLDRMCMIAAQGVSSSASVIIGQTVGRGEFKRAAKEGWTFLLLSALIGFVAAVLVLLVGTWSIGLYEIQDATKAIAASMMEASALIVFFQSIQSALSKGILRGSGDTKFLMIADILFQWCLSIPLGYVCGLVLKLDPAIVLLILRVDYVIKSIWLILRMRSGKWIHKAKSMDEPRPAD